MKAKQILGKYYRRLLAEGIINSAMAGLAAAAAVCTVFAVLYWTLGIGSMLLGAPLGVAVGAGLGIAVYFLKYRLTDRTVARRIDRCGLRERIITMVELEADDSTTANLQRRDAISSLSGVSDRDIKLNISPLFSALLAAAISLCAVFSTLGILADAGVIPFGRDMIDSGLDGSYDVIYTSTEGGYIKGESEQSVEHGGSSEPVRAVANDGWMFIGWDDGYASVERCDSDIKRNLTFKARFKKIGSPDPDDEVSDSADDIPSADVIEESGGGSSDQEGGDNIKDDGDGGGGGKWQDRNQFIDGATYYRDYLEFYYNYATGIFDAVSDIPEEIIKFFETYFSGI